MIKQVKEDLKLAYQELKEIKETEGYSFNYFETLAEISDLKKLGLKYYDL
jgi:hypothetical protein